MVSVCFILSASAASRRARAGSCRPRRHLLEPPVARSKPDRPLGSTSRLLPHPLAMSLILGIDPDSPLQGGWSSSVKTASFRLPDRSWLARTWPIQEFPAGCRYISGLLFPLTTPLFPGKFPREIYPFGTRRTSSPQGPTRPPPKLHTPPTSGMCEPNTKSPGIPSDTDPKDAHDGPSSRTRSRDQGPSLGSLP